MPGAWITDLRHFEDDDGGAAELPAPALALARFLRSITGWMTSRPVDEVERTNVWCRRKPGRRPCPGEIHATLDPGDGNIEWWCPESLKSQCRDVG
jgi:hypothetical protein